MAARKKPARKASPRGGRRKGAAQARWYDSNWFLLVLAVLIVVGVRVYHARQSSDPVAATAEDPVEEPTAETPTPAPPPEVVTTEVMGSVDYRGMLRDEVVVPAVDRRSCPEHVAGALRVSDGHLADALVWLDGAQGEVTAAGGVTLTCRDCQFEPRAAVILAGSTLSWTSEDDVEHRIVARDADGGEVFTLELPPGGQGTHTVAAPGVLQLSCARHPWEHATLLVAENTLAGVTDVDGRFGFGAVRPATDGAAATLRVYHPLLGHHEQALELGSGQPLDLEIDLSERAL